MNTIVISLGGSLIVPKPGEVNIALLTKFRRLILSYVKKTGHRAVIVTGGGKLNKKYNESILKIAKPKPVDLDWLGIAATRFHAEFVRLSFGNYAWSGIIHNPTKRINTDKKIICAGGWKPGCSTDKDAVLLAKTYGSPVVVNLTNIDYVYSKDPKRYPDAKIIKDAAWKEYFKMIPKKWSPRLNTPFDPVASRLAYKYRISTVIINGLKFDELAKYLRKKDYKGTYLHP